MRTTGIALLMVLAIGCGEPAGGPPADAPEFEVERIASGGPVTLTVRVSVAELGLAETLDLEEEVTAEPGFVAELPEFLPEEFEGLGVIDIEEAPVERRGGASRLRRRLVLEPERSGTLVIPPREAWFSREDDEGESSVATESIDIRVRSIEDATALPLPPSRPVLREEEIAGDGGFSPWWAALLVVPAAATVLLVLRRRGRSAPPPRPAHEIAWESLRRLVALDLISRGEVERFFVTLSAILREYVERRFGVRAPERTTQEFLLEAAHHANLSSHRAKLGSFLGVADRVKFARYSPEEADIQEAFDRARTFLEETAEEAEDA